MRKTIYIDDQTQALIGDLKKLSATKLFKELALYKFGDKKPLSQPARAFDLSSIVTGEKLSDNDFVFDGFKRGTVGFLSGEGGLGKTTLALLIASQLATNVNISSLNSIKKINITYVTCEDSAEEIHDLLIDISDHFSERCDFPKNEIVERLSLLDFRNGNSDFIDDDDKESLKNVLESDFKGTDLFIFDTFSDLHSLDENSTKEMNRLMKELVRFAEKMEAAVLILHHTTKTANLTIQQMRSQSVVRGSSVIVNKAKFFIRLTPIEKGEIKLGPNETLSDYVHATIGGNKSRTKEIVFSRTKNGVLEPLGHEYEPKILDEELEIKKLKIETKPKIDNSFLNLMGGTE